MYDVAIIGAGISGCSVAYYLTRYKLSTVLFEKDSDICEGTSKANTAIVHAGHDAEPGSNKCRFNLLGNAMYEDLCAALSVPFRRNGTLVVAFEGQHADLVALYEQGKSNGVPGIEIVNRERLRALSPHLTKDAVEAVFVPSGGIVSPYELVVAMCENAIINGAELLVDTQVESIRKTERGFEIATPKGVYEAKAVVNCAGLYADAVHNMISHDRMCISPRKGEYLLLDKVHGGSFDISICTLPVKKASGHTKGVWIAPTVSGNILLGPTASDQDDKEDTSNTARGFAEILEKSAELWPDLPKGDIIGNFAGLRAHADQNDFIIGEAADCSGFFDCAGIESPGLTSAPAFGQQIADQVAARLGAEKRNPIPGRDVSPTPFRYMSESEREQAIAKDPSYGRIVCRCENVTEAEIRSSIRRAAGAWTLDAVKRRTRAGMGRCQGGFCCTRVMQIISEETKIPMQDITKFGCGSEMMQPASFEEGV